MIIMGDVEVNVEPEINSFTGRAPSRDRLRMIDPEVSGLDSAQLARGKHPV